MQLQTAFIQGVKIRGDSDIIMRDANPRAAFAFGLMIVSTPKPMPFRTVLHSFARISSQETFFVNDFTRTGTQTPRGYDQIHH